ncbi:MAG TPA: hypothetical protein PKY12_11525 [Catalimonadaceae bacterium]|nr:hypothetical protein [Catalimonadaceae bacterium]
MPHLYGFKNRYLSTALRAFLALTIFTFVLFSCKKENPETLADFLNKDSTQCYKCQEAGQLSTRDSLACENLCGITHFNPGNKGWVSVSGFGIGASGNNASFSISPRTDGHSYKFSISAAQSNSYYHTSDEFAFSIDSVEGIGTYILDTLLPMQGNVLARQVNNLGTRNWEMRGAKLSPSGSDCLTLGWIHSNHILTITQWGPVGSVIKGRITGTLFAFPSTCKNWDDMPYECSFARIR